jgi:hypothetical protein
MRNGLAGVLGGQTTVCGPARDALITGAAFVIRDGLVLPTGWHAPTGRGSVTPES